MMLSSNVIIMEVFVGCECLVSSKPPQRLTDCAVVRRVYSVEMFALVFCFFDKIEIEKKKTRSNFHYLQKYLPEFIII